MMISEGCQISARDKLGRTPLHYAAATAQYQCVLSLVANGASLTVTDNFKRTPLHYAATSDGDAKSVFTYMYNVHVYMYNVHACTGNMHDNSDIRTCTCMHEVISTRRTIYIVATMYMYI